MQLLIATVLNTEQSQRFSCSRSMTNHPAF